jgi:hypothetical protein
MLGETPRDSLCAILREKRPPPIAVRKEILARYSERNGVENRSAQAGVNGNHTQ